jgi:hypothetical protein
MAIDVSGLNFFMPIFSFLFVFIVVYALLEKTKILAGTKFIHFLISFIVAIVFISFSSIEFYVRQIIPWAVVLIVILLFVLLIAGFSTKSLDKIMTPAFAWVFIGILILVFLIAAIKVFNPVLHSSSGIVEGHGGETIWLQIRDFFGSSTVGGSILLIVVAVIISWIIAKAK